MTSSLKQRVPMAEIVGDKAYVTLEWLRDLKSDIASAGTTTKIVTGGATTTPAAVDLTALTARVTAAETSLTALTTRVKKLEQGYQA